MYHVWTDYVFFPLSNREYFRLHAMYALCIFLLMSWHRKIFECGRSHQCPRRDVLPPCSWPDRRLIRLHLHFE